MTNKKRYIKQNKKNIQMRITGQRKTASVIPQLPEGMTQEDYEREVFGNGLVFEEQAELQESN